MGRELPLAETMNRAIGRSWQEAEQGNRTAGQNVEKDQAQETEGTAHEQCVPMRTKGIWAL